MADIAIHFDREAGRLKALHGVNNGPVCYGSLIDVSHYYKQAGIPLVRLHDPNWPHPREVDIYAVFPDFTKDPNDPASYDFSRTDDYIRSIANTGAKIVYRLGVSIEHTRRKYYIHPPADVHKWAQICIGIIRHYNEGWADGFHCGIAYWEIWNEPDKPTGPEHSMWGGTPEQFYALYAAAAVAIKRHDASLKVGGYGATSVNNRTYLERFLAYCRERSLPLDFFSWHVYGAEPDRIVREAAYARERLDAYGYGQTESHLNEWNYFDGDFRTLWLPGNEHLRRGVFERMKSHIGASFVANVLLRLQDSPVDAANYYDGQPTATFCGLFDYYGVPQKAYYAFTAVQELVRLSRRVEANVGPQASGIACCAAANEEGEAAVLISNFGGRNRDYSLSMSGLPNGRAICRQFRLDDQLRLDPVEVCEMDETAGEMTVYVPGYSVVLLKLNWRAPMAGTPTACRE